MELSHTCPCGLYANLLPMAPAYGVQEIEQHQQLMLINKQYISTKFNYYCLVFVFTADSVAYYWCFVQSAYTVLAQLSNNKEFQNRRLANVLPAPSVSCFSILVIMVYNNLGKYLLLCVIRGSSLLCVVACRVGTTTCRDTKQL